MPKIITGAGNITSWAKGWFNNPNKNPDDVFTAGMPQAKFVYVQEGKIHAVEYPEGSRLQHPQILQELGINIASVILAGTLWVLSPNLMEIQIQTATPSLLDQVRKAIQIDPLLPETLRGQFTPFWGSVEILDDSNN